MPKATGANREPFVFEGVELRLRKGIYPEGLGLSVSADYSGHEALEPYADISVNFGGRGIEPREAFVDTNNLPGIDKWLVDNGLAESTPIVMVSRYCEYPLMRFDEDFLASIPGEGPIGLKSSIAQVRAEVASAKTAASTMRASARQPPVR